jgi:hypothetical protein
MSGVEDRVREFLGSWKHGTTVETEICCECGMEIRDGVFVLIDGKSTCLKCREKNGTDKS